MTAAVAPVQKAWATRRMRAVIAELLPVFPDAACHGHEDPDLWHPVRPNRRQEFTAINICRTCPAITSCLVYAMRAHPLQGIWGGTTMEMRDFLRAHRAVFVERVDFSVPLEIC